MEHDGRVHVDEPSQGRTLLCFHKPYSRNPTIEDSQLSGPRSLRRKVEEVLCLAELSDNHARICETRE